MTEPPPGAGYAKYAVRLGTNPDTSAAIVRVRERLPDEVMRFAVDRCAFFFLGNAVQGQTMPRRFVDVREWLIVLYDLAPHLEAVIAHEVAHAYLGHGTGRPARLLSAPKGVICAPCRFRLGYWVCADERGRTGAHCWCPRGTDGLNAGLGGVWRRGPGARGAGRHAGGVDGGAGP
jgi:hypothetical protein